MRFSLQDVKKTVQRRGGVPSVSLSFLRPGDLHDAITKLIDYHERLLGQPQRLFAQDEARACIGDYRLAGCLIATLSRWYSWRQREWEVTLNELRPDVTTAWPPEYTSSIQLRLALFDYINEHCQGFLANHERAVILRDFASLYQLDSSALEYLLALDSDEEALLTRDANRPPEPQEVATLYNQWAFESALFNSSSVYFVINCRAFAAQEGIGMGAGAAIKRLSFLARKLGVYYDLAYDDAAAEMTGPERLTLTLYGPQEVSGAPQQYGLRLARLCRLLLGYGSSQVPRKRSAFATAIVEAEATVHLGQRSYQFSLDGQLLRLFPAQEGQAEPTPGPSVTLFDSGIEQSFGEAFMALAVRQGVDGWKLEREPEPLLLKQQIFIPDFALTRDQRRIYVEILGFWTPSYRERKVQKLQQLRERDDLVLVIPVEAKEAFASVTPSFPVVYYTGQISISDLLHLLRARYDDFEERLARMDVEGLRGQIRRAGLLTEHLCSTQLRCYRRSELEQAASRIICAGIAYQAGLGFYTQAWIERLRLLFTDWLRVNGPCSLAEAMNEIRRAAGLEEETEAASFESLLALWSELRVRRDSIFDAIVEMVGEEQVAPDDPALPEDPPASRERSERSERRVVRERRPKRRSVPAQAPTQGDLWGA